MAGTDVPAVPGSDAQAVDRSAAFASGSLYLDDDDDDRKLATTSSSAAPTASDSRYFFGLLDHRSSYGNDFFHDPFLGPEFDAERQVEIDYQHSEGRGTRGDQVDAGFQWNVAGELTVAGEFGWDSEYQGVGEDGKTISPMTARGFENVDLAIYHPLFQFVSDSAWFDYTLAARLDVGIPTRTAASGTDAQLSPYLGQLIRLGKHLDIEAWTGAQFTIGPSQTNQFIYGVSAGYAISGEQLRLPFTASLTPIVELDGQTGLSENGGDALFGVAGCDLALSQIKGLQPEVEIGYEFPIDQGARDQLHWGIVLQLFVQF